MPLKQYRQKRDFRRTGEPKGAISGRRGKKVFVIHEHHASVMHFDLRLEIGGVLKSWSVPKGPSLDPQVKRLAIEVEDHPIEYAGFSGAIPEGQYGAGRSLIWDEGRVEIHEPDPVRAWKEGHLGFTLSGRKLSGDFSLVRMRGGKTKPQWLLKKKKDEHAEPGWRLELVEPDKRFNPESDWRGGTKPRRSSRSTERSKVKESKRRKTPEPETAETISVAAFIGRESLEGDIGLKIGKPVLEVTNLDKIFWPKEKISKGDLIRYYLRIGQTILPHLKDRPAILKRYPNGIEREPFYQHNVTSAPEFIETAPLKNEAGRTINYVVFTDLASLIYTVNLGAISQHPWLARAGSLDQPDFVVFDLDPKGAPFGNVLKVARAMKRSLDRMRVKGFVKSSGSSGIHVFIPIKRGYTFEQTMDWAESVAGEVASGNPKIATTERRLSERERSQVYIDWQQNARGKSIAAPYTVQPKPKATVSAPVSWDEVEAGFKITDFTIETMPERIEEAGDLWRDLLRTRQSLPETGRTS